MSICESQQKSTWFDFQENKINSEDNWLKKKKRTNLLFFYHKWTVEFELLQKQSWNLNLNLMTEKAKIPSNQSQIIKIKSMNPLNTQKTFEIE